MALCAFVRLQQKCETLTEENLRLKEAVTRMREEMVQISEVHRAFTNRYFVDCLSSMLPPQLCHLATTDNVHRITATRTQSLRAHPPHRHRWHRNVPRHDRIMAIHPRMFPSAPRDFGRACGAAC